MKKMAQKQKKYEKEYKVQAVKLAKEIGAGKAAKELGIPVDTLYGWQKAVREGRLEAGPGARPPGDAMSLAEELAVLRKQNKALEREIRRLKEENEFLAEAMWEIYNEDVCNDTYGRRRMYQALLLKQPEGVTIPSESTVYRVMKEIDMVHHPKRRPNSITKADREARKSDDLLKRDFVAAPPWKSASPTSRSSKQRTASCTSRPSSTVSISLSWAWPWMTI